VEDKKIIETQELVLCRCHSPEHQLIFRKFTDEPEVYISMFLQEYGFFSRLRMGLRYIFGYKCKYGHFDEVVVDKQILIDLLEKLKNGSDEVAETAV